jgi:glycosyltransferase involved in cell wall biosynthesis
MINLSSPSGNNIEVINSFLGIGYIWSSHAEAKIIRAFVKPLMRLALRGSMSRTTFSNSADRRTFIENGLVTPERSQVLSSEFVNTSEFFPRGYGSSTESKFAGSQVRIVMASRLLWDKGVQEFVDAASVLRQKHGDQVEFVLAGEPDKKGRGWIPEQQLKKWDSRGVINWIGHCDAMPSLLRSADIAVLPSQYNEGLPRFLVEAAATGLPIVASDLAGCRRVVVNQANGFLIEPGSVEDLISRLSTLINSPERRAEMGEKSRLKAKKEYSDNVMIKKWMNMYN